MTEPNNFILRWARLKHEQDIEQKIAASRNGSAIEPKEAVLARPEATAAPPRIDAAADEPFDPSGLPSIEAITANTDVRGFLECRVPAELTRDALRRAWTSDPAIRDFIGIAENQWDFNDPNAIPGFGPLGVTSHKPAIVTQLLSELERLPQTSSESSAAERPDPSAATGSSHSTPQQKVVEQSSVDEGVSRLSNEKRGTVAEAEGAVTGETRDRLRNHRYHGSALPR